MQSGVYFSKSFLIEMLHGKTRTKMWGNLRNDKFWQNGFFFVVIQREKNCKNLKHSNFNIKF